MKRVLALVAVAAVAASVSHGASVGGNAVGYVQVNIPPGGGLSFVALNFGKIGGGGLTLSEIFGTGWLSTGQVPTQADSISIWTGTTYASYFQKPNGLFYSSSNPFGAPVDPVINPGESFWLKSKPTSTNTNTLYFSGQVVAAPTSAQSLQGLSSLRLPYLADFVVTNNDWIAEGANGGNVPTQADLLSVWIGNTYQNYFIKSDGTWRNSSDPFSPTPVSPVIPVGVGAWYKVKTSDTNGFTAVFDRPYTFPAN